MNKRMLLLAAVAWLAAPALAGNNGESSIVAFAASGTEPEGWALPEERLHVYSEAAGPFILVLPMTGDSDYRLSRIFCRRFVKEGFRCAYLERHLPPESLFPRDVDALVKLPGFPPQSAQDARNALDALEKEGCIAPGEKVGIVGVSLGAIDAAIVAQTDARIAAAALLLGGGNIPKIMASIHGAGVKGFALLREEVMKELNLNPQEFEKLVAQKAQPCDPLTYCRADAPDDEPRLAPERYLMINVKGDPAIPNESSEELRDALSRGARRPDYEVIAFPCIPVYFRHLAGVLETRHAETRMARHFQRYLKR